LALTWINSPHLKETRNARDIARHQWCLVLVANIGQFRSNRAVGHPCAIPLRGENGCSTRMVWQPSLAAIRAVLAATASSMPDPGKCATIKLLMQRHLRVRRSISVR
jgi:hypothetical protein